MDIISFLESLVILIGFTLPIAHVAEIIADSAGEKWWLSLRNQRRKNLNDYTKLETPMP
tara:strand:- start:730 stop:906 length:177 start_codon:yes stop_codon:yes gene_type:complete